MTRPVGDAAIPIIDTHQHLWDINKFKLAWLTPDSPLNRCALPADYAREAEGLNIVKSIYMEVDVIESQQPAEARWVLDLCDRDKAMPCAAVISGRPNSDKFAAYLDEFRDRKTLKGVRQVLHVPARRRGTASPPSSWPGCGSSASGD